MSSCPGQSWRSGAGLVLGLAEALAWRADLARAGRTLVVTNGCFDLLHRGHVEYLGAARDQGDALLVLLNADLSIRTLKGPGRPVLPEADRAVILAGLAAVSAVVVFATPRCTAEIAQLRPEVYVKGGDYTLATLDPEERDALKAAGVRIVFIPFRAGCSTSAILAQVRRPSS